MKKTFQFWGYRPDLFLDVVGRGRPIGCAPSLSSQPIFGRVALCEELVERCGPLQSCCAQGWSSWLLYDPNVNVMGEPLAWFCEPSGRRRALVTRTADNAFRFWFDLDGTVRFIQNERYLSAGPPVYLKLGINPTRLPTRLCKTAFTAMHWLRSLRKPTDFLFPQRAGDPSVDAWRFIVQSIVEEYSVARAMPFWPEGKQYAVTLNHDIDSDYGFRNRRILERFSKIEEDAAARSAWMVVTKLLPVGRAALDDLHAAGHEIGFHGSRHDHKLAYLPPKRMAQRIECALELIDRYQTMGVRSPSYLRSPALYQALDGLFAYDMSMHDAIFAPTALSTIHEGCSTTMPFRIAGTNLLEIPTTIPEDWTFDLERLSPEEAWRVQTEALARIKARGGVANILTHPEPHHSIKPRWLELYRRLVTLIAADSDAWIALPRDINRHWRSRQATIASRWTNKPAVRDGEPINIGAP